MQFSTIHIQNMRYGLEYLPRNSVYKHKCIKSTIFDNSSNVDWSDQRDGVWLPKKSYLEFTNSVMTNSCSYFFHNVRIMYVWHKSKLVCLAEKPW